MSLLSGSAGFVQQVIAADGFGLLIGQDKLFHVPQPARSEYINSCAASFDCAQGRLYGANPDKNVKAAVHQMSDVVGNGGYCEKKIFGRAVLCSDLNCCVGQCSRWTDHHAG